MQNLVLFLVLTLFSVQVKAGFYGEPLVNRMGSAWTQDAAITSPIAAVKGEANFSGFQYGGRVGYIWTNFNFWFTGISC